MNLTERNILELIRKGEGIAAEFKTCRDRISRDVYETVCAFLNRHGGTILLGIEDSGNVQGIDAEAIPQLKKDFVTAINNPQKIHPPAYLSVDDVLLKGKEILRIYVPESSQVHRCNGRIYDRNEDGDLDITDHTRQVADLYQRKQATYSENKIYPYAGIEHMRADLIERCRRLVGVWRNDHPWLDMDDLALLKSAQLYQTDHVTGESGVTLAGVLLLGQDSVILSAVPHHRTDLILRKVDLDRYDDRDLVRTNLIESYERIIAFVQKHLPDPFYLEGMERISIRDAIFREVASNILIHREYTNAFPAKLIIERGWVRTENSNKPHGFGALDPESFAPFPKNPVISAFFREIHRADELGSGMRRMMKYGKTYGGENPQMIEGDVFRILVKVPEFDAVKKAASKQTGKIGDRDREHDGVYDGVHDGVHDGHLNQTERNILACLETAKSTPQLLSELGYSRRTRNYETAMRRLLTLKLVEMTIPDKPRSKKQQYRLTQKGKQMIRGLRPKALD